MKFYFLLYRKSIKKRYTNNKFILSRPIWDKEFELPDESYSVSDIQDFFEYIIRWYETFTNNPPLRIYINKN